MTREIKFRGKRLGNGEWVYGSYLPSTDDESEAFILTYAPHDPDYIWEKVDFDTVGQYTGIKDKNGREIYAGDILGSKGRVIGWVKGGVRGYCYDVVYINHPAGESDWPLYSTVKYDYPEQIEVIGNIHDNPEILEAGNK